MSTVQHAVGVWVPIDPDHPMPPPESRPMGRAALALRSAGIELIFGDDMRDGTLGGMVAREGGWQAGVVRLPCLALSSLVWP